MKDNSSPSADKVEPDHQERTTNVDFFWFTLLFSEIFIVPFFTLACANWIRYISPKGWFAIFLVVVFFIVLSLALFFRVRGLYRPKFVSFESFGWIVLIAGEVVVWFAIIPDNIKDPFLQSASVLYSNFVSSPEMFRVFIIGVVVLFISKMYGTHERMVAATKSVGEGLEEMKKELPGIAQTLSDSKRMVETGINLVLTDINVSWEEMARRQSLGQRIIDAISKDRTEGGKLAEQMQTFVEQSREYVNAAYSQLRPGEDMSEPEYDFHLHTYLAMFAKYLELEKRILSPPENYAHEYRTWFVFYALVVRAVVEALPCHWKKCEFYTILPKKPSQFFNILDSGVAIEWEEQFLEQFCWEFIKANDIDYYRYFLMTDDGVEDHVGIIPKRIEFYDELDNWYILVDKKDGEVDRALTVENIANLRKKMNDASEVCASSLWNLQQPEKARKMEHGKRYIIVRRRDFDSLKTKNIDIDRDSFFSTMREAMIVYHKTDQHCRSRILERKEFSELFSPIEPRRFPVPRDLFAVKERNGDWLYCIGAFQDSATSDSMTVRVYTPGCKSWDEIQEILNKLFIEVDNQKCHFL